MFFPITFPRRGGTARNAYVDRSEVNIDTYGAQFGQQRPTNGKFGEGKINNIGCQQGRLRLAEVPAQRRPAQPELGIVIRRRGLPLLVLDPAMEEAWAQALQRDRPLEYLV